MSISKTSILQQYSFFRDAPEALQKEILSIGSQVRLDPRTHFFDKGSDCAQVALVGEGRVRVFIAGASGREITLYNVGPGETCPVNLLCTVLGRQAPANAVVEEPLQGLILPAERFRRWVAEHDAVRRYVFDAIAIRFVDICTLMEEITTRKVDQRLAALLLKYFISSEDVSPVVKITHEKLAYELGSAREVMSRLLGEFERAGAIELGRGRIVLRDQNYLREVAGMQEHS